MRGTAISGATAPAHVLTTNGAGVNASPHPGITPRMLAAVYGHLDAARWLLEHGADPAAATPAGGCALGRAARTGHIEIVRLLIQAGAPVDGPPGAGWPPLKVPRVYGHDDIARVLLAAGAADFPRGLWDRRLQKVGAFLRSLIPNRLTEWPARPKQQRGRR